MEEHDSRLKQYRLIDHIVESAFRNAIPFYWQNRNHKEIMIFSGEPERLTLTYRHRVDATGSALRFLRLFAENGKLIAEYRDLPFVPAETQNLPFERETLASGIQTVRFIYADLRDNRLEWHESWNVEEMKNMPMAIQMEVTFSDGTTQVWLRRTAGNGEFQTFGRRLNR